MVCIISFDEKREDLERLSTYNLNRQAMFPIPVKVKNVSVYPYVNPYGGGANPEVKPVIEQAEGEYSVGTLFTNVLYNLTLQNGTHRKELTIHESYVAVGETEDGKPFTSHWMYCLKAGETPIFGLTIHAYYVPHHYTPGSPSTPPYFPIAQLTNITVSQLFPPPAIGQTLLITGGTGSIIATKVGTPHEMGVEVVSGDYIGALSVGLQNVIITGENPDGQLITFSSMTCVNAENPVVFVRQLI